MKNDSPRNDAIGMATMSQDGTIVLDLHARGDRGESGLARLVYPSGHRQYHEILNHLGGIRSGEQKLVRPWA